MQILIKKLLYIPKNFLFIIFFSVNFFLFLGCEKESKNKSLPTPLVLVEVAKPWASDTSNTSINENKKSVSSNDGSVYADNSGSVLEILVKKGDQIREGEALIRLDPRDIRLSDSSARYKFEAAKAKLASQEADFLRFTELKDRNFISDADWQNKRALILSYRADFEVLSDQLGVISVRAYQKGKVKKILVTKGQSVIAGDKIIKLDMNLKKNNFYKKVSPKKRNLNIGFQIPLTALVEGKKIMKLSHQDIKKFASKGKSRVKEVFVRTGIINETKIQVLSGIEAGDYIVVVGGHLLSDGQEVRFYR